MRYVVGRKSQGSRYVFTGRAYWAGVLRHATGECSVFSPKRKCWWDKPRKNFEIRKDAPSSRQPLVKGERLVRSELGAAMVCECSFW